MNHQTTLPITAARVKIFDIASKVQKPGLYYTLTNNGRPQAVIMSAQEFESWAETLEVMRDFPHIAKDAKEARRDYASGKWKKYTTLEQVIATARNYGVSRSAKTKRRKSVSKNR